jgi:hypothetical protein
VPAREKLVSLFEPHTDIIRRNKRGRPVEYGHKVLRISVARFRRRILN